MIAGIFGLFPAPAAQTFGSQYGPQVYALVLVASPAQSIISLVMINVLYDVIGEQLILLSGTLSAIVAIYINSKFSEELDFKNLGDMVKWNNL